jgi:hypothetical protein
MDKPNQLDSHAQSLRVSSLAKTFVQKVQKIPVPKQLSDIHIRINPEYERFLRTSEPYKFQTDTIALVQEANAYMHGRVVCTSREHAVAILLSRDAVLDSRFLAPATLEPMPTLPENYRAMKTWNDMTIVSAGKHENLLLPSHAGRIIRDTEPDDLSATS